MSFLHFLHRRFLIVFLLVFPFAIFAEQKGLFRPKAHSIEAILYGVNLNVTSYKGEAISYEAKIEDGGKISIVEDAYLVRFRNSHPVRGIVNVFVPENMKVESLRIYASGANVTVNNVNAVYFVSSMCHGNVEIKNCLLKCASFSMASGVLNMNAEITTTCDFCFADTKSEISLKGDFSSYNFFYPYEMDSVLKLNGKLYSKDDRFIFDKKKKKRVELTQTLSQTSLSFQK